MTVTEYDSKGKKDRNAYIALVLQKIQDSYESREKEKHKVSCVRNLFESRNAFGTSRLYSLIYSEINRGRESDPDNTSIVNLVLAVTQRECSDPENDPAVSKDKYLGECGTAGAIEKVLIDQEGYAIVVQFDRHISTDDNYNDRYLMSFVLAHPKTKDWFFLNSDRARGYDREKEVQILCVEGGGENLVIEDYKNTRKVYDNIITLDIDGEERAIKQGEFNAITREYAREQQDKIDKMRGTRDSRADNPNFIEVLGHRFDYREARKACVAARHRWNRKRCKTYEEMIDFYNERGSFIAFQAIGKSKDDYKYIITTLVNEDLNKLLILYTALDGGTVPRELGRGIKFMNWAMDELENMQ